MTKVFILTTGKYDEYTVIAVVSDKTKAKQFVKDGIDPYEYRAFEEFELDELPSPIEFGPFIGPIESNKTALIPIKIPIN